MEVNFIIYALIIFLMWAIIPTKPKRGVVDMVESNYKRVYFDNLFGGDR